MQYNYEGAVLHFSTGDLIVTSDQQNVLERCTHVINRAEFG